MKKLLLPVLIMLLGLSESTYILASAGKPSKLVSSENEGEIPPPPPYPESDDEDMAQELQKEKAKNAKLAQELRMANDEIERLRKIIIDMRKTIIETQENMERMKKLALEIKAERDRERQRS